MKFEPLSHCPNRAAAAVLRVGFGTRPCGGRTSGPADLAGSPAIAAQGFFTRMRSAIARLFTRKADAPRDGCRCDVDARLLELETRKLDSQMFGGLRD
jgi:hypothetical protein